MSTGKKIWAQLPPLPKQQLVSMVQGFEGAGLEGVWCSQTFGAPFVPLAAAAVASDQLKLGSGIALAFTRSPLETACNAMDLDMISGGRCVLGLGSSAKSLMDAFGVAYGKPLEHMREVVGQVRTVIKAAHTGDLGKLEGKYHSLELEHFQTLAPPLRTRIPIYLPAIFEKACEMAGELADGLLGHPLWADKWIHDKVASHVGIGLGRAGRQRGDIDINLMVFVAVNEDKRQAIEDSRPTIAWYSQSPQYHRYFDYLGFGAEALAIQQAFARKDYAGMTAACSDAMVEAIALVGGRDEVRRRMAARAQVADSITPVIPHYGIDDQQRIDYSQAIAAAFYE
jgi:probable F420-dependent oxidoreductase